jgi:hypothetical protein
MTQTAAVQPVNSVVPVVKAEKAAKVVNPILGSTVSSWDTAKGVRMFGPLVLRPAALDETDRIALVASGIRPDAKVVLAFGAKGESMAVFGPSSQEQVALFASLRQSAVIKHRK